jgi:DNA-binding PadR family transcriptional regulator
MDVKQLCLGVLTSGEATGYDVKRYFEDNFEHFFRAGFGSIYPSLNNLLEHGLVTCTEQCQDHLPDKKIYTITERGRQEFEGALLAAKPQHKLRSHFLVLMHFSHLIPAPHIADLIEEHIIELEETLSVLSQKSQTIGDDATPGMKFALHYGEQLALHAREFVENEGERLISELVAA